jgi:hypothetical protein
MSYNYQKIYTNNKKSYAELCHLNHMVHDQSNQVNEIVGGGQSMITRNSYGKKFQDNIFLNKEYFGQNHNLQHRKKRLRDFMQIAKALDKHLVPINKAEIDKKLLKRYVKLYKKKNRQMIQELLDNLQYVKFDEFLEQLIVQIERFNSYIATEKITKYVFVIGVGNDAGFTSNNFNLFKSNFWVFLLAYKHLKIKPYDIILNLNIAIRLYHPTINDFLLMDDCSYSGSQLVDSVLKNSVSELLYSHEKSYVVVDRGQVTFEPILDKNCNVHIIIPYMSSAALAKINDFEITSSIRIIKYISRVIKTYGEILNEATLKNVSELYKKYYNYVDFPSLTPVFFQHKIADMISTIDLILIKGQVLDDPAKKLVFIKECIYDKNDKNKYDLNPKDPGFIQKKLYCPNPPYLEFIKYLQ